MILLTGTADLLNILTGGAQSVDWNCSWNDMNYTAGTFLPGSAEGNIAAAATTNIVGAPAASVQRQIKFLSLTNKDATNPVAITVIKSSGGTGYNLTGAWSIPAGWTLYYLDGQGFVVQNASGAIQYVGAAGATGGTGAQGNPGVATYLEADPGEQGDQGFPGPTGPQGLTGFQGAVGPATYLEADATEGDIGPPGVQGAQGITGVQGPIGPPVYLDADAGDQGDQGFPGPIGATGPQGLQGIQGDQGDAGDDGVPIPGNQGVQGAQGIQGLQGLQGIQGDQGDTGDDGQPIPGNQGIQGAVGATGSQGPSGYGPPGADGDTGEDGMPIPGNQGLTGPPGATGAQGPASPTDNLMWLELDRDDEAWLTTLPNYGPVSSTQINGFGTGSAPGNDPHDLWLEADRDQEAWPQGVSGANALVLDPTGAGLTASTTINDTTTMTSGGITLANQTATAGQVYRVRAYGTFTAVSSATVRSAQMAPFWGSTQLAGVSVTVAASTAQTTAWALELDITCTSTTAVWNSGTWSNGISSTTGVVTRTRVVPASTTVAAGPQAVDMRFSMSAAVATDSWTIDAVTIERIK